MASVQKTPLYAGYRNWFQSYRYGRHEIIPIFILDYEPDSIWENQYPEHSDYYEDEFRNKSRLINGIQIYFLDETKNKMKAFLRHDPYFYLLLEENLTQTRIRRLINRIYEVGEKKVIKVEEGNYYDAKDLTFLVEKRFLKVTVDHPGNVPNLRKICEVMKGIVEWREADILYHHRVAIDYDVRVGSWYNADIRGGEIKSLTKIHDKAPPEFKLLAFDIETVFEQTREPNPNRDSISMISLFVGTKSRNGNLLIVNSQAIETDNIRDFDILLKSNDKDHSIPWVDWQYSDEQNQNNDSTIIEKYPMKTIIVKNERDLLDLFFQYINDYRPDIVCDFFGTRFDIPFLAVRSDKYNKSFEKETGLRIIFKNQKRSERSGSANLSKNYVTSQIDYVTGAGIIHLDAYLFNEKYSYLPKKDLGLKPSVKKKLKIIPIGREALYAMRENPAAAAAYAGCDGYITWKYCNEIVLDFFISMGQMFPVPSSELLARRSGFLDDLLIDAEGFKHQIVGKRRADQKNVSSFSSNIVVESLAYTGGLVEARKIGIFRSDIMYDYTPNKEALNNFKKLVREIIIEETENQRKREIKAEFNKILSQRLDDSKVEFNGNPEEFLKDLEFNFLRNGVNKEQFSEKIENIRGALEAIPKYESLDVENEIERVLSRIEEVISLKNQTQLRGVHVDVTSMYPSQIRQYKLQPSGIVSLNRCRTCNLYESDNSCLFDGDWVLKITARRPCKFRIKNDGKCDPDICTSQDETTCKNYEPAQNGKSNSQEIFTFDGKKTKSYIINENKILEEVELNKTYFGSEIDRDPFAILQQWLINSLESTQLTTKLNENRFDIFEEQGTEIELPSNTYMSIDVRTKNISILLSVSSRVCQKAYNFVARIMDDFFNTRVRHKIEAQRLKHNISQRRNKQKRISPDLIKQQKYHDSTQLGLKVPLNSIYGLLGMKSGVRNSSIPCAGITTKLSADLIYWAANQLEQIGLVTELDTDGIWLWVPKAFPLEFAVKIRSPFNGGSIRAIKVTLLDKILNAKVTSTGFRNDNYWLNDGKKIIKSSKSLIRFEQDGPYDFMFIMGKKKYIVYNYNNEKKTWIEKEITGLESKRADFSQLQKYFQESIINSYLEFYNPENPISLSELYQNANQTTEKIRSEIMDGKLDPAFFVKPKAINKPLKAYKSKLPQVTAASILKDLGFSVDPGIRVEMLNIKGNQVIPRQIFDFGFKKIKDVLIKHGICTLSFMVGEINNKEDLRSLIDVSQYLNDIFGPGRIYERMVSYPMHIQQIITDKQQTLDIDEIIKKSIEQNTNKFTSTMEELNSKENNFFKDKKPLKPNRKRKSTSNRSISVNKKEKISYDLEEILNTESKKKIISKSIRKKKKSIHKKDILNNKSQIVNSSSSEVINSLEEAFKDHIKVEDSLTHLISLEELEELENEELNINLYSPNDNEFQKRDEKVSDELTVCSECGALVNYQEITDEGCVFCGGQKRSI